MIFTVLVKLMEKKKKNSGINTRNFGTLGQPISGHYNKSVIEKYTQVPRISFQKKLFSFLV